MELDNLLNIINNSSNEDNKELEKNYYQHNSEINQKLYPNYFMNKNEYKTIDENKDNILSQKQTLKDNIKPKITFNKDLQNQTKQTNTQTTNSDNTSQETLNNQQNNNNFFNIFGNDSNNNFTKLLPLLLTMKNGINPASLMSLMGINNPVLAEMLKNNNQPTFNNKKNVVNTNYIDSDSDPKISSYKRIF